MSNNNKRGEVLESWMNSFGFGTIIFLVFVVVFILTMFGVF
ncbi:hypothetical protein AAS21_gp212 [Pantoea phage vB_PagS_AAS21]|uniref:Uncharacterized protein n=1 Tax=Pantoea phage vB_PagS_AAS21 TaxID=2575261 RepID=A0A4Y5P1W4_9CAUD|nr:hypothetical protein AAS21_gp212 [Pantoea phage vB_PagS_AAS21]